jgi:hypothetical protein
MAISIHSTSEPEVFETLPEPEKSNDGLTPDMDIEPLEGLGDGKTLLGLMGVEDMPDDLASEDLENLQEVEQYIARVMNKSGKSQTKTAFKNTLDDLKEQFGLLNESDPQTVIERIGNVVKSWKDLSFVKDARDKRRIFMKLSKAESAKDMNKIVFQEMERYSVWQ